MEKLVLYLVERGPECAARIELDSESRGCILHWFFGVAELMAGCKGRTRDCFAVGGLEGFGAFWLRGLCTAVSVKLSIVSDHTKCGCTLNT